MSDITYRDAAPADADTLSKLGTATFMETFGHLYKDEDIASFLTIHSIETWAAHLANPLYDIRLAESDGEAIGYARVGPLELPVEASGTPWELKQLYVLKPWQGEGVAATLMDWVLEQARDRGGDALYLSVFSDNHRAQRFYARYGLSFVKPYIYMVGDQADDDEIWSMTL